MKVTLEYHELQNLLIDAGEISVKKALVELGLIKPIISQSQAYSLYGRKRIDRWVKEGLIKRIKDGDNNSSVSFDRILLETLSKSSNRMSYFESL